MYVQICLFSIVHPEEEEKMEWGEGSLSGYYQEFSSLVGRVEVPCL